MFSLMYYYKLNTFVYVTNFVKRFSIKRFKLFDLCLLSKILCAGSFTIIAFRDWSRQYLSNKVNDSRSVGYTASLS